MQLKPQQFGLAGKEYRYSDYIRAVHSAVKKSNLDDEVKVYCEALLDHADGKITDTKMRIFASDASSSEAVLARKQDIQKFYGEVIGPVWTSATNAFGDIPDKKNVFIFHPTAENEPLTDYEVRYEEIQKTKKGGGSNRHKVCKNRIHSPTKLTKAKQLVEGTLRKNRISAKSGKTTNTVKSRDILYLIDSRPGLKKFWEGSMQYEVLEILRDTNTAAGPMEAAKYMTDNGIINSYFKGTAAKKLIDGAKGGVMKTFLGKPITEVLTTSEIQSLKEVIKQDNKLSGKFLNRDEVKVISSDKDILIVGYIAVATERRVEKASKNSNELEFYEIFGDAVAGMINYVTFNLGNDMFPKWKAAGENALENTKGHFRSKNTMSTRLAERGMADGLGFQPEFG